MWLFTPFGFFSVVQKPYDPPGILTVRARAREDLEALTQRIAGYFTTGQPEAIKDDPRADYRYRMRVPASVVALVMSRVVTDIRYDNFKHEVARLQGDDRARLYGSVWAVMLGLQRQPAQAAEPFDGEPLSAEQEAEYEAYLRECAEFGEEEAPAARWWEPVDANDAEAY